jgi:hypothetical protein
MFNINAYKANGLVYGGARPSQFAVYLTVPSGIGIDNVSVDKFRFVCEGASLPMGQVSEIEVPYFGRKIKVAGDRTFENWNVTVQNDEDFSVRALFETWSNALNRIVANVRDQNLDTENYKADLEVIQFGKDGSAIRSYIIVGAFPTTIDAMDLNWDTTNTIEKFNVTFAYDYWLPNIETSDKKAGGVNVYGPSTLQDGPLGPA